MTYVTIDFAGHSFRMDASDEMDLVAQQIASGGYEAPLSFLMMATLLRTEGLFVDVGANGPVANAIRPAFTPH